MTYYTGTVFININAQFYVSNATYTVNSLKWGKKLNILINNIWT